MESPVYRMIHLLSSLVLPAFLLGGCVSLPTVAERDTANDDERTIASALREALQMGTRRTVERTGRVDGYLANEMIRIGLPDEIEAVATRMRQIGLGGQIDQLEVAMNRAAEEAAKEATTVFSDAIRNMRPADVYAVLNGGQHAATQYLREQSEGTLRRRYQPIVQSRLQSVNAYGHYQELVRAWNRLPLVQPLSVDLDDYVTEQALNGLFTVLAEEEQRIRTDPAARTTELLRRVFGNN